MRQVNLRAMRKDPFYEYKESFDYFDEMLSNQNEKLKTLFNIQLISENINSSKNKLNQTNENRRIVSKKL